MTAWILAIGRMLGLGSIAGIRPSLTLAVIGVVGYFDWGVETNSTFSWLNNWLAIGIFVVLAILESAFDKISKVDRLQDRLIMPYRLVMGGVAGAATIPFGWKGVVVGAAVGAGASWFAQYTKHLSRPKSVREPGGGDAHQHRRGARGLLRQRPGARRAVLRLRVRGGDRLHLLARAHAAAVEVPEDAADRCARAAAGRAGGRVAGRTRVRRRSRAAEKAPMSDASDLGVRRLRMVEEQLVRRGLRDEDVLSAMRSVPRHLFVPEAAVEDAYADSPLPIGLGQTISQPYMVALMTALLEVDVRSRVLEIGAGSGYQSAVLAEVAGEVFAIERLAPLAERARATLDRLGYANIRLAIGDGARGWHEQAPFQGILVAAAADEVPPELLGQLADGGRLVIPVGRGRGEQVLTIIERDGDAFVERHDTRCRFVPLIRDVSPDDRRAAALRGSGADVDAGWASPGGEDARGDSTYPGEAA